MKVEEKILLVQLLLEDIRGNWGYVWSYGRNAEQRALKAKSLCQEIAAELNDDNYIILAKTCDDYIRGSIEWGDWDGRFFRESFPFGYENMSALHGLTETYNDKSKGFKVVAKRYLTYPQHRFDDWEDN